MKKFLLLSCVIWCLGTARVEAELPLYTFMVNIMPDGLNIPMLGLVNIAKGDHASLQIGLADITNGNMSGWQTGLVNVTGGDVKGIQIGLANITQGDTAGLNIGLLNISQNIAGLQIGLFNIVESSENGVPLGLISIVRNGGYHAIEAGFQGGNETAYIAFKLGIEKLYTTYHVFYNPFDESKAGCGLGVGSIINVSDALFINPEVVATNYSFVKERQGNMNFEFDLLAGWNITESFSLIAGPSFIVQWKNQDDFDTPVFKIGTTAINDDARYFISGKACVRLRF